VIADADGRSNFGALQERLGKAKTDAARAAHQTPAVLLAFDLVRHAGAALTDHPRRDRRWRLGVLLEPQYECLQVVAQTQTTSLKEAEDWLAFVRGLEGAGAKRCDGRYLPGQRDWIKVKRQRTADCAVIGIAGDQAQPALFRELR
jgi:ATP-dependent DNA ligase